MFAGSTEIQMLCWAVVLGLVQLVIATSMATLDQGLPYNLSPRDLPPPRLELDWHVPPFARMGFQYPTDKFPEYQMQISIAPRTIEQYSKEMVSWGVGHELVHYVFILRENHWHYGQATFQDHLKHHCNPEFKQITRAIADEIWKIYHSDTQRAAMYDEVEKSCFNEPNQ